MQVENILEIHNFIASLVFENAPIDWKIFRINIEMLFDEGEEESDANSQIVYCYKGESLKHDVDYLPDDGFNYELCDFFEKLNNACLKLEQRERWTVCDFIITDTGKYKVAYSYGNPPRLSGDYLAGTTDSRPIIEPYI